MLSAISKLMVGLVAAIHVIISIFEIFFWKHIYGLINLTLDEAKPATPIVANAGLYNGFLAAGLIWGLSLRDGTSVKVFFLVCVIVAGVFGAITLGRVDPLLLQSVPGAIALLLVYRSKT